MRNLQYQCKIYKLSYFQYVIGNFPLDINRKKKKFPCMLVSKVFCTIVRTLLQYSFILFYFEVAAFVEWLFMKKTEENNLVGNAKCDLSCPDIYSTCEFIS